MLWPNSDRLPWPRFNLDLCNIYMVNMQVSIEIFSVVYTFVMENPQVVLILQSEPLFIGISRRVVNVRPTAFFYIKCALSSTQVKEYYRMAADGFESTKILAINPVPCQCLLLSATVAPRLFFLLPHSLGFLYFSLEQLPHLYLVRSTGFGLVEDEHKKSH